MILNEILIERVSFGELVQLWLQIDCHKSGVDYELCHDVEIDPLEGEKGKPLILDLPIQPSFMSKIREIFILC